MPLYDYYCRFCHKLFEAIVPLALSGKELKCKYCGKPLKKLVAAPFFKVN
jgi:putative FmdB family regulatory protein